MMRLAGILAVVLMLWSAAPAAAQRERHPAPSEVIAAAKKVKFEPTLEGLATKNKKVARFTPIKTPVVWDRKVLASGHVVGQLFVDGVKPFPLGIYPIYVYQLKGKWHAVALDKGKIFAHAKFVMVEARDTARKVKTTVDLNPKVVARVGKTRITMEW